MRSMLYCFTVILISTPTRNRLTVLFRHSIETDRENDGADTHLVRERPSTVVWLSHCGVIVLALRVELVSMHAS